MDRKKLSMIAAACGAVVFVAMFLPFASFSGPSQFVALLPTFNGFDWDGGVVVLILSLVAGAAALLVFLGKTDVVPLDGRQLLFVGVGGFAVAALLLVIKFFDDWPSGQGGGISRGIGLYLMLLATLAGAAACFLATKNAPASLSGDDD